MIKGNSVVWKIFHKYRCFQRVCDKKSDNVGDKWAKTYNGTNVNKLTNKMKIIAILNDLVVYWYQFKSLYPIGNSYARR